MDRGARAVRSGGTELSGLSRLDHSLMTTAGGGLTPDDRGFRLAAALTRIGDTDAVIVHVFLGTLVMPSPLKTEYLAAVGGAVLIASLLAQILKRIIRRPRPSVANTEFKSFLEEPDPYSMPSGHTSAAFALAIATLAVVPVLGAIELAVATAIAASRVLTGAHYPMDVGAGMLVGTGVALAVMQWTTIALGG